MGYDLHITRKQNWFDDRGEEISLADWKAYVDADPEIRMDNFAEAKTPDGTTVRMERAGLSVWTSYSRHLDGGNMAWFDFKNGCIVVKNPDPEIRQKMWKIARSISARVQGDEGEYYGADGNPS